MKKRFYAILLSAVAVAAGINAASAQIVYVPDQAVFNSASTINTTIDFQNLTSPTFFSPPTYTNSGITFNAVGLNASLEALDGGNLGISSSNIVLMASASVVFPNTDLSITLPIGVTAFGFNLKGNTTTSGGFDVTVHSGTSSLTTLVATPNFNSFSFAGFISSSDITSVDISVPTLGGGGTVIDDVMAGVGNIAAVPEPSTWVTTALALGAVGYLQRRRVGDSLRRRVNS
jgi:hypothetical protein